MKNFLPPWRNFPEPREEKNYQENCFRQALLLVVSRLTHFSFDNFLESLFIPSLSLCAQAIDFTAKSLYEQFWFDARGAFTKLRNGTHESRVIPFTIQHAIRLKKWAVLCFFSFTFRLFPILAPFFSYSQMWEGNSVINIAIYIQMKRTVRPPRAKKERQKAPLLRCLRRLNESN